MANPYITVEDVRNVGLTDAVADDTTVEAAIAMWQQFIERATRQWFYELELELNVDGTDSDLLAFGVPIISIEELRINGDPNALDTRYYKVYNSRQYPMDRQNPRIQLIDTLNQEPDIYTAPLRDGRLMFRKGRQNQYIKGTFGYVEADGSTPLMIQRALLKLVIEKLSKPVYMDPSKPMPPPPPSLSGVVMEEWTDAHKIRYAQSGGGVKDRAPGLVGITDDQEILTILKLYRAPIGCATPANPSYR